MGWICTRCGTENNFSRPFCIVCRFEPDKGFLHKELRAAKREKAAAQDVAKKKRRDHQTARCLLFWLNAAALAMMLLFFAASAITSGLFTSPDAKSILVGDFSRHQGMNRVQTQVISCKWQLDESLELLTRTGLARYTALKSVEVSTAAMYADAAFDTAGIILQARSSQLLARAERRLSDLPSPVRFVQELPQLVLQRLRQLVP